MKILCLLFVVCLSSCYVPSKIIPLKGTYSDGNFEEYSDKSKDEVWDNIIEFFAKSGVTIRIIDRSSGLIISGTTALTWTYEDTKGVPVKKDAYVVIQKVIDGNTKKPIRPIMVTGEWNIRIKEKDGKTLINVNLVNPSYQSSATDNVPTIFKKGAIQSTEVFERLIYEKIK